MLAKTTTPQALIAGTIYETEKAVLSAGGQCLAIGLDVRHEDAVRDAIDRTIATFGGIDVVINNASAMHPHRLQDLDVKKFDLMNDVIVRGSFLVTKYSLPHLMKSANPHVLNICPPLHIVDNWFKYLGHLAVMKYAVSLSTLSLSQDLSEYGIAVNALWPKTAFWSAFMSRAGGYTDALRQFSRKPDIMSDAAYCMITKESKAYTGNFMYDDDVLLAEGVTDFDAYSEVPGNPLMVDIFVKEEDCKTFTPLTSPEEATKGIQKMLAAKPKL